MDKLSLAQLSSAYSILFHNIRILIFSLQLKLFIISSLKLSL